MTRYLIDTNVLLAASACQDPQSGVSRAMPREDALRALEYDWLIRFRDSEDRLLLDDSLLIQDEYRRNLPFNRASHHPEFGSQVLEDKLEKGQVDYVPIDWTEREGERIALLPEGLEDLVTDREDRKWIATALSALQRFEGPCVLVYGADTDWHLIEHRLESYGLRFLRLLPDDWYRQHEAGKHRGHH